MTRPELIGRLEELAKDAKGAGELLAAGVLYSLCAALHAGSERALFDLCGDFSLAEIERLTGEPDWSEDTLKV